MKPRVQAPARHEGGVILGLGSASDRDRAVPAIPAQATCVTLGRAARDGERAEIALDAAAIARRVVFEIVKPVIVAVPNVPVEVPLLIAPPKSYCRVVSPVIPIVPKLADAATVGGMLPEIGHWWSRACRRFRLPPAVDRTGNVVFRESCRPVTEKVPGANSLLTPPPPYASLPEIMSSSRASDAR